MHLGTGELLLRVTLAAVLGAAVGVERESASRGAGARTHALVSMGAALFTIAGAYGFTDAGGSGDIDPTRVAAQVAAGVGFIGAGAILRNGTSVLGVTTAATVWLSAAVGLTAAAGGYLAATAGTVLAIIALISLRAAKPWTRRFGRQRTTIEFEYERGHGTIGPLLRALNGFDSRVENVIVDDDEEDAMGDGVRRVTVQVNVRRLDDIDDMLDTVKKRPEIRNVRVAPGEVA